MDKRIIDLNMMSIFSYVGVFLVNLSIIRVPLILVHFMITVCESCR